jgi:hypothetical protein
LTRKTSDSFDLGKNGSQLRVEGELDKIPASLPD